MAKILILACACFAIANLTPTVRATDDEVLKDIAAGDEAKKHWDYDEAIKCFSRALAKDPDDVLALAYRGLMYTRTGQLNLALADSTRAIQLDPKFAPAYYSRAVAFYHRDEPDKAIADLSEAARLDPDSSEYISLRADYCYRQGQTEQAMADFNRAIELSPGDAVNFCARGDLRAELGDYSGAALDYVRAQKLDPDYSAPYVSYGWLLATCWDTQIRDSAKAVEYAKIGLDLNPKREESWMTYAAALAAAGNFDQAVEWQQRYASSKVHSQASRVQAESLLALYKSHQPLYQPPPPIKKIITPATEPVDEP